MGWLNQAHLLNRWILVGNRWVVHDLNIYDNILTYSNNEIFFLLKLGTYLCLFVSEILIRELLSSHYLYMNYDVTLIYRPIFLQEFITKTWLLLLDIAMKTPIWGWSMSIWQMETWHGICQVLIMLKIFHYRHINFLPTCKFIKL